MKNGTKSLLFGVHQFLIHPIIILWAWWIIYRRFPRLYELCAIITHDWGYWGLAKMDDEQGERHPKIIADWWWKIGSTSLTSTFRWSVSQEILGHSRFYITRHGGNPTLLFRADKLAIALYPRWLYLLLANLSGEIKEYIEIANNNKDGKYIHLLVDTSSQTRWLLELQAHMIMMGLRGTNYDETIKKDKQHTTTDIECESCGWRGSRQALIIFQQANEGLCPACGVSDSIIELDGVSEDDYKMQESRNRGEIR